MEKQGYYDIHTSYYLNDPDTQENLSGYYDGSENEMNDGNFQRNWVYFGICMILYVSFCYRRTGFRRDTDLNDRLVENENESIIQETIEKVKKNKISLNDIPNNDNTCSICLEDFSENKENIILECKHIYHEDCIIGWLNKDTSCPLCRSSSLV